MAGGTGLARWTVLGTGETGSLGVRRAAAVTERRALGAGAAAGFGRDGWLDRRGRCGGRGDGQASGCGSDGVDQHGRERPAEQDAQQLLEQEQEAGDAGQGRRGAGRSFAVGPPGSGRGGGGGRGLCVSITHCELDTMTDAKWASGFVRERIFFCHRRADRPMRESSGTLEELCLLPFAAGRMHIRRETVEVGCHPNPASQGTRPTAVLLRCRGAACRSQAHASRRAVARFVCGWMATVTLFC